jgi:hypothetical protein
LGARHTRGAAHVLPSAGVDKPGCYKGEERTLVGAAHHAPRLRERDEAEVAGEARADRLPEVAHTVASRGCAPVGRVEDVLAPVIVDCIDGESLADGWIDAQRRHARAHEAREVIGIERSAGVREDAGTPGRQLACGAALRLGAIGAEGLPSIGYRVSSVERELLGAEGRLLSVECLVLKLATPWRWGRGRGVGRGRVVSRASVPIAAA